MKRKQLEKPDLMRKLEMFIIVKDLDEIDLLHFFGHHNGLKVEDYNSDWENWRIDTCK